MTTVDPNDIDWLDDVLTVLREHAMLPDDVQIDRSGEGDTMRFLLVYEIEPATDNGEDGGAES